jgi:hypothetical protein
MLGCVVVFVVGFFSFVVFCFLHSDYKFSTKPSTPCLTKQQKFLKKHAHGHVFYAHYQAFEKFQSEFSVKTPKFGQYFDSN